MIRPRAATLLLGLCVAGCAPTRERNVIVGRAPFAQAQLRFDPGATDRVIGAIRQWAAANGMVFRLAHDGRAPGDFNASADTADLNLKVARTGDADATHLHLSAIAKEQPTPADRTQFQQFVQLIRDAER